MHDGFGIFLMDYWSFKFFLNEFLMLFMNNWLVDIMNDFFMSLMDDWLMNLSNFFFVDNWDMVLMNNVLMLLMNYVFMVLVNNILMVLMDYVFVMLFDNWLINMGLDFGGKYVLLDLSAGDMSLKNWLLIVSDHSGTLLK